MEPKYDIAISFAGEDRIIAEQIVTALDKENVTVFYDEYEQANLWGKDLYQYLTNTYSKNSEYCIILISEHYPNKNWTKLELKAAQERDLSQEKEYILPVRIDDTQVPGLRNTIGYLDLNGVGVNGVVKATLKKLGRNTHTSSKVSEESGSTNNPFDFENPRMPNFKKEFTDKEKEDFLHEGFKVIKSYIKQGLTSIEKNSPEIETSFTEIHALKFTGKVYLNGQQKVRFIIWIDNEQSIAYREEYTSIDDSSKNEIIYVEAGKSELLFKPMFMGMTTGHIWDDQARFLNQKKVAEYLWDKVMYKVEM